MKEKTIDERFEMCLKKLTNKIGTVVGLELSNESELAALEREEGHQLFDEAIEILTMKMKKPTEKRDES